MRVVVLSNLESGPGYVVRQVVQRFPDARVLQVQHVSRKASWTRRLKNACRGTWLCRGEQRVFYRNYFQRGLQRMDDLLYGPAGPEPLPAAAQIPSTTVNHPSTAALLASLRPDVLLVAGAPLLKSRIFSIPRLAAINVHFGISPMYRGEHTLFWPIYCRDFRNVGVTVHLIDKGIDTGRMLAQGFIGIAEGDDEWSLEVKAARAAADLILQLLVGDQWEPCWQPPLVTRGRAYRFTDRRIWHDAMLAVRRRWFGERLPTVAARTVNYCVSPTGEISDAPATMSVA